MPFPQLGGLELANLTHRTLYGQDGFNVAGGVLTVRDEYLAWVMEEGDHWNRSLLERMFDAP
jgi:hypothetical protein